MKIDICLEKEIGVSSEKIAAAKLYFVKRTI